MIEKIARDGHQNAKKSTYESSKGGTSVPQNSLQSYNSIRAMLSNPTKTKAKKQSCREVEWVAHPHH